MSRASRWRARQDRDEQRRQGKHGASEIEAVLREVLGNDHPGLRIDEPSPAEVKGGHGPTRESADDGSRAFGESVAKPEAET
jgi:hypothetical protein